MLTEQVLTPIFSDINPNDKTVSVAIVTLILKDGVELSRSEHRCAFAPGQIDAVKAYIGADSSPEIDYLNAIWTKDVISAYLASINQEQAIMST